ncbi:MAG TPA: CoA ester lyase [Candidatus Binataceae bacterium]|nr:CoA ester lyase [Candidatus Binataceae bacterium]
MYVLDKGQRFVIPRTEMTYPGHSMKLHQNAADAQKSPVDHVMADFEDACPYEFKGEKSRKIMVEAMNTLDFGKKVVTIRPNNIHSKFFKGDMEAIMLGAPNRFHGIMLPKTRGPEEIREVSKLLDDLEKRGGWTYRVQIESLIETPHAVVKAYDIATASDRMCGLVFGIADYAANLGIREIVDNQNQNFHYSKQAVVVAAKAAGLHAVDNVFLRLWRKEDSPERVADLQKQLRDKNTGSANLGMDGTWVIHPQQAEIANSCYSPTQEQIDEARRVVKLYHEKGGGSMADPKSGEMIDEATIKIALMDLAKGAQGGVVSDAELREWSAKSRDITGYDILELMRRVA